MVHGFSMPPYGKDGGMRRRSHEPQRYGPARASAAVRKASTSANSVAAAASSGGSAQTRERGPTRARPNSTMPRKPASRKKADLTS